jgi:hypothetical protein
MDRTLFNEPATSEYELCVPPSSAGVAVDRACWLVDRASPRSDDLVLLHTTGLLPHLPASAIRSFFGLLEAVESAEDLSDLAALRSLGLTEAGASLRLALADGFSCLAICQPDAGRIVLEFSAIVEES